LDQQLTGYLCADDIQRAVKSLGIDDDIGSDKQWKAIIQKARRNEAGHVNYNDVLSALRKLYTEALHTHDSVAASTLLGAAQVPRKEAQAPPGRRPGSASYMPRRPQSAGSSRPATPLSSRPPTPLSGRSADARRRSAHERLKRLKERIEQHTTGGDSQLIKSFHYLDKNRDGVITLQEFRALLAGFQIYEDDDSLHAMFDLIDTDHTHYIDYTEFVKWMSEDDWRPDVRGAMIFGAPTRDHAIEKVKRNMGKYQSRPRSVRGKDDRSTQGSRPSSAMNLALGGLQMVGTASVLSSRPATPCR